MNKKNLDQALAALADALYSEANNDPLSVITNLPKQSISGDYIHGGKITNFKSSGITDTASREQIVISDDKVTVKTLASNTFTADTVNAANINVDILTVKEIKTTLKLEKDSSVTFTGPDVYSKGLLWQSRDYNKQFVFNPNPDRFFSSEIIDINKGKFLSVGGVKAIDDEEIGPTVWKSNLREVGTLKGLKVDGDVTLNNYIFFNTTLDRLGIGTDIPHAALSVAEMGIEVMLGTDDELKGMIGTFAPVDFNIVTDNTARITVTAAGNVLLGNPGKVVSVQGKLGVGVKNVDQNVDLHVAGPVRLNNRIQMYAEAAPTEGTFGVGDIVFNSNPGVGKFVGWVCTNAGAPGSWYPFGEIKDRK